MRVIGSVSSEDKAKYVIEQLGADECFNYTKEPCGDALKRLAPDGLDVVYENVGGDHFQAAIDNMKWFGKIIVCGMVSGGLLARTGHSPGLWTPSLTLSQVSQYNKKPEEKYGVTNLDDIFRKRILIQGFIYWDHEIYNGNIDAFWEKMPRWISEGGIKTRTTRFEGFDKAQEAFLSLFTGKTFGKATLKVADP